MKKAFRAIKNRLFSNAEQDNRFELKKGIRPNRRLHRGQLKTMLRWDQTPIIAYK